MIQSDISILETEEKIRRILEEGDYVAIPQIKIYLAFSLESKEIFKHYRNEMQQDFLKFTVLNQLIDQNTPYENQDHRQSSYLFDLLFFLSFFSLTFLE
jgi:hypothetical protein